MSWRQRDTNNTRQYSDFCTDVNLPRVELQHSKLSNSLLSNSTFYCFLFIRCHLKMVTILADSSLNLDTISGNNLAIKLSRILKNASGNGVEFVHISDFLSQNYSTINQRNEPKMVNHLNIFSKLSSRKYYFILAFFRNILSLSFYHFIIIIFIINFLIYSKSLKYHKSSFFRIYFIFQNFKSPQFSSKLCNILLLKSSYNIF